jgi:hypothetical protein
MNQPATPSAVAQSFGIATLKGRIAARRKTASKIGMPIVTLIRLPAPDEYTSPQTVEVRSAEPIGKPGDDVTVKVRIGGFSRSYDKTDAETGEVEVVNTADNALYAVAE